MEIALLKKWKIGVMIAICIILVILIAMMIYQQQYTEWLRKEGQYYPAGTQGHIIISDDQFIGFDQLSPYSWFYACRNATIGQDNYFLCQDFHTKSSNHYQWFEPDFSALNNLKLNSLQIIPVFPTPDRVCKTNVTLYGYNYQNQSKGQLLDTVYFERIIKGQKFTALTLLPILFTIGIILFIIKKIIDIKNHTKHKQKGYEENEIKRTS